MNLIELNEIVSMFICLLLRFAAVFFFFFFGWNSSSRFLKMMKFLFFPLTGKYFLVDIWPDTKWEKNIFRLHCINVFLGLVVNDDEKVYRFVSYLMYKFSLVKSIESIENRSIFGNNSTTTCMVDMFFFLVDLGLFCFINDKNTKHKL